MQVTIKYNDNDSLTPDEIIARTKSIYGNSAEVSIQPTNQSPEEHIYHGILLLITEEQVRLFFDSGKYLYQDKLPVLRNELLDKLTSILDKVIIDNEERII